MIQDLPDIKIMTVQEVADLLRVHRTTVSRYAKSGELRSYLIGTRRVFRFDDVWTFFENRVADEYVFGKENA
jgi:excisionase family DNA binding protein